MTIRSENSKMLIETLEETKAALAVLVNNQQSEQTSILAENEKLKRDLFTSERLLEEMARDHRAKVVEIRLWKEESDRKNVQQLLGKEMEFEDLRSYATRIWAKLCKREEKIISLHRLLAAETTEKERQNGLYLNKVDEFEKL